MTKPVFDGARPARPRGAGTIARVALVAVAFAAALAGLWTLRARLMPEAPARAATTRAAVSADEPAAIPPVITEPTPDVVATAPDAGAEPAVAEPTVAEPAIAEQILALGGVDAGQPAQPASDATRGIPAVQAAQQTIASEPRRLRAAGGLSDEEVVDIVRTHEPALTACYESALKQGRRKYGKMVLHFDITPRGEATRFAFEGDSLRSAKVRDCIVRRARDWRFPTFSGDPVRVAYPLYFRPA
ncbi:AgmX/PglI C-terminal domain-containing protein [Myxococcota bacterium]|nr:AgmX/PglI C-terminal domain-containing protein [Myxococcota bacterium]